MNNDVINKLLLAFLEEKCHIHPTGEVVWEPDYDGSTSSTVYYPIIKGFESGIRISDSDLLDWLIETDKRVSEVKDYSIK